MTNEIKLIEVKSAWKKAQRIYSDPVLLHVIKNVLDETPTADAVEVVHGEWKITEDDYFDLVELKCSVCGESYGFEDYEDDTPKNYRYCPNCGAKMDGKEVL